MACHSLPLSRTRSTVLFLPETGVLDTELLRVERIFLNTGLALCFVVLERLERRASHKEQDQDADDIQPRHNADTEVAHRPGQRGFTNRSVENRH